MSDTRRAHKMGMRAEAYIFLFLLAFFVTVGIIYYVMSHELVGSVALALSALLCLMVVAYMVLVGREIGQRPEDNHHGEIIEGAGELGFFPPKSIWPFWCALTVTLIFLGPVFGWWITLVGVGLGIWALSGMVFEFYRGDYAH